MAVAEDDDRRILARALNFVGRVRHSLRNVCPVLSRPGAMVDPVDVIEIDAASRRVDDA